MPAKKKTAMDGLNEIAENIDEWLNSDTLVGDIRDTMLEIFKHRPKPWSAMSEDDQHDMADFLQTASRNFVESAVGMIRNGGGDGVRAILEKYADKGEITVTLKVSRSAVMEGQDVIGTLHDCVGKYVMVVPASVEDYAGEQAPVQIDADQPEIPMSDGIDADLAGDEF